MMESVDTTRRRSHNRRSMAYGSKRFYWILGERILFVLGLLLLAHPFLGQRYFFTVDGPSHVYDAWLILELFHPTAGIHPLWEFNALPVPDWSGHALLALLLTVTEPQEALKVVHLLCVLGFVIAFRMVVSQRMQGPLWLSYLAFPFAVTASFIMGYFNFVLALALVMLIIRQWRRITEEDGSKARWLWLSVLLLVCYFSHLMPFLFVVGWMGAQLLENWWLVLVKKTGSNTLILRRTLFLGFAVLPSLLLLAWFLVGSAAGSAWVDAPKDRMEQIWKSFVMIERVPELILWTASVFLVLFAFISGIPVVGSAQVPSTPHAGRAASLVYATAMLLLIFILPDGFGKGGDILFRLAVLVHIAFLVAIPFVGMAARWGASLAAAALLITFGQQQLRAPVFDWYADMLKSTTEICAQGPPGRTVAFIALDWNFAHLPELGFASSKAIDYSHYELNLSHFPLHWRREHLEMLHAAPPDPLDVLGDLSGLPGAVLRSCDEVVVVGEIRNDQQRELIQLLDRELSASHREGPGSEVCRVFRRNPDNDG